MGKKVKDKRRAKLKAERKIQKIKMYYLDVKVVVLKRKYQDQ